MSATPPAAAATARKIILDCDPGHDDAVALLLAHADPRIDLVAVTTIGGNQTLEKVTRNTLGILSLIGCTDVPAARVPSCGRSRSRRRSTARAASTASTCPSRA